jgi:SAM-dependent methyltransferase
MLERTRTTLASGPRQEIEFLPAGETEEMRLGRNRPAARTSRRKRKIDDGTKDGAREHDILSGSGAGCTSGRMDPDLPFDRALRRLRRDRAAQRFDSADLLHRRAAEELLARLELVQRSFTDILLIGHAGPFLADRLPTGAATLCADSGRRFAERSGGLVCDEDRLPFAKGSFDLILSVGVLDQVNDLPGALTLLRQALRPDGLLLAAMAGAGSLPRLREAMAAADEAQYGAAAAHLHPQIDVRTAGDLLARAGFALPVADAETVLVRYPGFDRLVADLRAMGATNLLAQRSRRPLLRSGLAAARAAFAAQADADGRVTERFELLHLTGWAPAPHQPRPAPRGSGKVSLADVLGGSGPRAAR